MRKLISIFVFVGVICALFYSANPMSPAYANNSDSKEFTNLVFADIEKQIHAINVL